MTMVTPEEVLTGHSPPLGLLLLVGQTGTYIQALDWWAGTMNHNHVHSPSPALSGFVPQPSGRTLFTY